MKTIQHRCCGAIPWHILNRIAERGDPDHRERARATLEEMHTLVGRRLLRADLPAALAGTQPKRQINIYDAQHRYRLPGKLVMSERSPRSDDVEVNEAFDGTGSYLDFFFKVFDWISIDGRGKRIDSSVHYGVHFENAMWDGHRMIYGDGDGRFFLRFTRSRDVIAHELGHGFTQFTAKLGYWGQNGALNEHISDAIGIMVKQYAFGILAIDSRWLIGEEILGPAVEHGDGIRSMAAPGTAYDDPVLGRDPQPAHMRDYVDTDDDNGGVHTNSGIPNHAFYLAAIEAGGYTWEGVGKVWIRSVQRLRRDATFVDFAQLTVTVAGELFGAGKVQKAITHGWSQVGVPVSHAVNVPAIHRLRNVPPLIQ